MRKVWIAALVAAFVGCDDGEEGATGGAGGAGGGVSLDMGPVGGAGGGGGAGGVGGAPQPDAALPDPDSGPFIVPDASPTECPAEARNVHTVVGQVQSDADAPVGQAKAQICIRLFSNGELLCLRPADTNGNGQFYVRMGEAARCMTGAVMRVLKPGTELAPTYCQIPINADGLVELPDPITLFATEQPTQRPPEGDGMTRLTVDFADGLSLDLVPNDLYTGADPGYPELGVARVDPADPRLCGADHQAFSGMYLFSPEADIENTPAPIRIPTALAEGTAVALYVMGGLNCTLVDGRHVEEAVWAEFTQATVGAGGVVSLDGENGLPCLSWLGWHAL